MLLAVVVTSFRHSVSWAQCRKQHMKNFKKSAARGNEKTPVGKLKTKGHSRYTRIWHTLWLVSFDRFCQHSSITDADEICDMAAVRDLSMSYTVFKPVINITLKDFPKVECLHEEQKNCIKLWSVEDVLICNPSHLFWKEFN